MRSKGTCMQQCTHQGFVNFYEIANIFKDVQEQSDSATAIQPIALQKQVGHYNLGVVTVVTDKLKVQWL